jgi:hypothetical protein
MSKTHFKKLMNPNYLGSWDFTNDDGTYREEVVTVRATRKETVFDGRGNSEELPVVFFDGLKMGMVMNSTNMKTLAMSTGSPYIEDWVGKPIGIRVEQVRAFGDTHDALRLFQPKGQKLPQAGKPEITPTHKAWAPAVQAVASGKYTKEQVLVKYAITGANDSLFDNAVEVAKKAAQ